MIIFRKPVAGVSGKSLDRFLSRARRAVGLRGRVMVLIAGNRELRSLNLRFRGRNEPTDVLSFPAMVELGDEVAGDLAISVQIAAANAVRLGHSLAEELKVLTLHGVLHLAGYDHETDHGEMARREDQLRHEFRLPATLIQRSNSGNLKGKCQHAHAIAEKRGARVGHLFAGITANSRKPHSGAGNGQRGRT